MMVSRKRGQAAMEFLMTYGWAILVVLVVIGALAYFGVLDPSNLLPEKCSLPSPFECSDYTLLDNAAGTDSITFFIRNGESRIMEIQKVNVSSIDSTPANGCIFNFTSSKPSARSGERINITVDRDGGNMATGCTLTDTGRKGKFKVDIVFNWRDNAAAKRTINGELFAAIQHS